MSKQVVVEPYNSEWALQFSQIKSLIWPSLQDFADSIEHVGSTSVPGLPAKPVIDIDVVIPDMSYLDRAITKLREHGYEHRGNLGIQGREAFRCKQSIHKHNLYVCPKESVALKNHLCLRDALLADSKLRDEYAHLKYDLAKRFPNSIDDYVEGKTDFILGVLSRHGYGSESLDAIRKANLAPSKKRE